MRRNDFIKGIKRVMRPVKKMQEAGSFSHKILFETAAVEAPPNREFAVIQTGPIYPRFFQWSISTALLLVMVPVFLVWTVFAFAIMFILSVPACMMAAWEELHKVPLIVRVFLVLSSCVVGPAIVIFCAKEFYTEHVAANDFHNSFRSLWRHIWRR